MATSNKNFRVKNGLTVESLNTAGVLLNNGSGDISTLNGTSGYVLTSAGPGSLPYWSTVTGSGSGGTYTVSSTAPSSPAVGDRWLDTNTGIEFTYLNDGNSNQWVDVGSGYIGIQGIQGLQGLQGGGFDQLQGIQGIQGTTGLQGFTGSQGTTGLQGFTGLQGLIGLQGFTGLQGFDGIQGTQGTIGLQGIAGAGGLSANNPTLTKIDSVNEGGQINWEPSNSPTGSTWFIDSFWNGSTTELRIGNTTTTIASFTPAGTFSVLTGSIIPVAGSSTEAPIDFQTQSAFVSSPTGGEFEFDGSSLFISGNPTTGSGRQIVDATQVFKLQSAGSAIGTGAASAFGATNRPYLQANRLYRFKYNMRYGSKTTAGTITCSLVPSVTSTMNAFAEVRVTATGASLTAGSLIASSATTTTGTASGSVANNSTNVNVLVDGWIVVGTACRIDLQILNSAGSTAALTANSNFFFEDLGPSTASYGNFG